MVFNVREYGAAGDGTTLDTAAFQRTVDEASRAGGTVLVPQGEYVVGTVFLKSHVTLEITSRARILGSTEIGDYDDTVPQAVEAPSFSRVLFYCENGENVTVCGTGTVDGRGAAFTKARNDRGNLMRPMLFRFVRCRNVFLRDVTFRNSASWCCHMISCDRVSVRGIRIDNHGNQNNDGFDLDSCRDVTISDTWISSIDDSICLKSTTPVPCEGICISNCVLSSETAAVKFGTSSRAGFRNVTISNCVFRDCPMGTLKFICVDGGILENVTVSNIVMDRVGSPLFIRLGARNRQFEKPEENDFYGEGTENDASPGKIRNLLISNVIAHVTGEKDRSPVMITGIPGAPVENVTLRDFDLTFPGGGTAEDAAGKVGEDPWKYPEQWFFGVLPAWGVFARHVRGLHMLNVSLRIESPDARLPEILEDVTEKT